MRLLALPLAIALLAPVFPFTVAAAVPKDPDLRGRAWRDVNADGVRQSSERGVADVAVVLLGRTTGQDDLVQLATTTTDRRGRYGFAGLDEGEYVVRFALPRGLAFTYQGVGGDDGRDSDVDPASGRTAAVVFTGRTIRDLDAGLLRLRALIPISGRAWEDWNDDGIQDPDEIPLGGVAVTLLREMRARQGPRRGGGRRPSRASRPRLEPVATIVTNAFGEYGFLVPRGRTRYRVLVAPPNGYETVLRDQGGDDELDSDIDPVSRRSDRFGARRDRVIDIGLTPLAPIGDRVWLDVNANGLQDRDEPGVPDVFVLLYRFDRAENAFVVDDLLLTDESGGFAFEPRRPGLYHLRFLPGDGHSFTRFNIGADAAVDSDAMTDTGVTPDIHLPDDGMPDGLPAARRLVTALARALAGLGRNLGARAAGGGGARIVGGAQPGGADQVTGFPGLAGFAADTRDAGLIPDERTATTSPVIDEGPIVCSTGGDVRDPQVTISDVRALRLPNGDHAFIVRMARALSDDYSFAVVLFVRTPLGVISFMWETHDGALRIGRMDPETGELIDDGAGEAAEIFHQRERGIVGFLLQGGTIPDDADMVIVRSFHSPRARSTTRCHETPAFEIPQP